MKKLLLFTGVSNGRILNVKLNLSNDGLVVQLRIQKVSKGILQLCDMSGAILRTIAEGKFTNYSEYEFLITDLPTGVYAIKFVSDVGIYWQYIFCDKIIESSKEKTY